MRFLFPCSTSKSGSTSSIGSTGTIALLVVLRLLQLVLLVVGDPGIEAQEKEYANYGVDVSWPMHHESVARQNLLGDRQGIYNQFMSDCGKYYPNYPTSPCLETERDRVRMNLSQPKSMQNYTSLGFKKIKCPEKVFKLIQQFWEQNKNNRSPENWFVGNTFTNHWESASYMVSVEDTNLRGGGTRLKDAIWDAARSTIEEWTGEELTPCSLYGIRIYENGAILAPHVDRLPLVSSAIINVDQDVDEPWPLEVIGHDGKAHNVTMQAGEMVLYESHSIIHGRPFPLKGRLYANIFIHFEPKGHSLRHDAVHLLDADQQHDVHEKYRKTVELKHGGHENSQLPIYILPGTPSAQEWIAQHPGGKEADEEEDEEEVVSDSRPEANIAASLGDLPRLREILEESPEDLTAEDSNGWQPIHEAARAGHLQIVQFLVDFGVDINVQTSEGYGATALYWAKEALGEDHPAVRSLESLGAIEIGPDDMEL